MYYSSKSVFGFVLEEIVVVVVDQNETSSSATTEMGVEAESDDVLLVSLELLGDKFGDSFLGDISLARMDDFQDLSKTLEQKKHIDRYHLLSGKKSVQ